MHITRSVECLPGFLFTVAVCMSAVSCTAVRNHGKSGAERPAPSDGSDAVVRGGEDAAHAEADNSRCHVCHINFEDEALAVTHAEANIGCEQCHGDSTPHCEDEDNVTAPDIIFAKADINAFCVRCHAELPPTDTGAHEAMPAGSSSETYCTECHGKHRVAHRNRRWDKKTRALIPSDGRETTEAN